MATLSTLFPVSQYLSGGGSNSFTQIFVYNTNVDSPQNGGSCCLWTVPAGTSWIRFGLWGGGSDGPGGCCCQQPNQSGGAGAYARKTVQAVPGNTYTICAGGSGCCSPNCCGTQGFASFVNKNGSTCAYAFGGHGGCALCFYKSQNCTGICQPASRRSNAGTGDIVYCTHEGMSVSHNFCWTGMFEALAGSPKYSQNLRHGADLCAVGITNMGCNYNRNHFPGGGGSGGSSCGGGCCWGGWGAGGMVVLTFYG